MAARAGADGSLCGSLRLGTRGRLSGRWRGVLGRLIEDGRARLHDGIEGLRGREKVRRRCWVNGSAGAGESEGWEMTGNRCVKGAGLYTSRRTGTDCWAFSGQLSRHATESTASAGREDNSQVRNVASRILVKWRGRRESD